MEVVEEALASDPTSVLSRHGPGSEMLEGITDGWPKVLSSLKSLLETGSPLPELW